MARTGVRDSRLHHIWVHGAVWARGYEPSRAYRSGRVCSFPRSRRMARTGVRGSRLHHIWVHDAVWARGHECAVSPVAAGWLVPACGAIAGMRLGFMARSGLAGRAIPPPTDQAGCAVSPVAAGWLVPASGDLACTTFGFMTRSGLAGTSHPAPLQI
jgi:hypothetical protein